MVSSNTEINAREHTLILHGFDNNIFKNYVFIKDRQRDTKPEIMSIYVKSSLNLDLVDRVKPFKCYNMSIKIICYVLILININKGRFLQTYEIFQRFAFITIQLQSLETLLNDFPT